MKEAEFLNYVMDVARRFSWSVWHVPSPMRASRSGKWVPAREAAGLCDLIMLHADPPRLLLVELKGDGGKLTDEQQEFLRLARAVAGATIELAWAASYVGKDEPTRFEANTIGVYVWKPGDEEALETILRSKVLT